VAVMYFTAQSCLHIVINFLWQPEPDQNMPHSLITGKHRIPQHSAKTYSNSEALVKIPSSAENCGS